MRAGPERNRKFLRVANTLFAKCMTTIYDITLAVRHVPQCVQRRINACRGS